MAGRYLIGCEILRDECRFLTRAKPCLAPVGATWLEMGLHDEPEKLHAAIAREVAQAGGGEYDAVLLLYGLCSNAILGLTTPRAPLVIPRVHDCISLFLGGARRYEQEHEREPGTYWFARGFMHRRDRSGGLMGHAPGEQEFTPARREELHAQYVERYGADNARYLMETWVDAWKRNYTRAVLLAWDYPLLAEDRARVRELARGNGWRYEEMAVDLRLVRMLLAGDWPEDEFLVLRPGESVRAAHDCKAICKQCG